MGEIRSDFIGSRFFTLTLSSLSSSSHDKFLLDPVTSVLLTQDAQTFLVTTLDSHIRLMDGATGKMLNQYTGHANEAYRCRACFGHGEGSVICGDEKGQVWAWDLLEVTCLAPPRIRVFLILDSQRYCNQILLPKFTTKL